MAGFNLGPSNNVGGYMEQLRQQNQGPNRTMGRVGGIPGKPTDFTGGFSGGLNRIRRMQNNPIASQGSSQGPSQGPVMPPSGFTPMNPSAGLPSGARSFMPSGGLQRSPTGETVEYNPDYMTPPAYTPPNPNPRGGIWDRFNAMARQRQY